VHAHQRFEEIEIGQLLRLAAAFAYRARPIEGGAQLGLVVRAHPDQHQLDLAGVERLAGGRNNRAIERVAMGGSGAARERQRRAGRGQ
jgi:hypothetical protein